MPVALAVAALLAVGIIVVGLRFLLVPAASAKAYGVAAEPRGDAGPYLSIKGLRDLTSGLIPLALLLAGQDVAVGWFLVVAAVIPIGDTVIVLRNGGRAAVAFGIHTATAVVMIAAGLVLILA